MSNFVNEFKLFQQVMYDNAAEHGFHDSDLESLADLQVSQRLMLITSELAEALEAVRKGNPPDSHIPEFTGLEAELADAVIRILDLAQTAKCRLAEALVAKAAYNASRPYKHGGKKF